MASLRKLPVSSLRRQRCSATLRASSVLQRPLSIHEDRCNNHRQSYHRYQQRNGKTSTRSNRNNKYFSSVASKNSGEDDFDEFDYDFDEDDEESFASSHQPWKTLLETPARASWRASDPQKDPPEYVHNAMYAILDEGARTSKQLKRAHRKVLDFQSSLAEVREKERRILVNGKRHYKQQQLQQQREREQQSDDDQDNNKRRETAYYNDSTQSSSVNPVYYGYDETLATLKHRLEPNFAITRRVLSECQSLLGGKIDEQSGQYVKHWQPTRILDFGIGCGSASAAAVDLFGSSDSAIEWIHGIDPSQTMRECSQKLIEEMTRDTSVPPPRITFSNSLTPSQDESEGSFDLALLVYTASDLPDISSCLAAAAMAFERLKPNGVLVMIEPGTPDGFNSTRAIRNMLLDCCPPHDPEFEWEDRCHIVAPCTHNGSCPMERHKKNFFKKKPIGKLGHDLPQELNESGDSDNEEGEYDNDEELDDDQDHVDLEEFQDALKMSETEAFSSSFCSFVHSMAGDSRRKGEKFSYLVAQKQRFRALDDNDPMTEGDPFREDNLTNLLADALDAGALEADDLANRTFESAQNLSERYANSLDDDLGLELLQGEAKRQSMGRIVRAPIKKKGHVYIDYCGGPGRIIRSRVTKALSNSVAPGIYSAARKARWGGLWPDTMDKLVSSDHSKGTKK
uniref:Methyltransferase domain-containing protein n=1 Tax=Pseudo-nitzschia delicatissima TaxID=44447 RepID=A0A7S0TDT7_9STRA|mmetsp:Transcript_2/g.10  ORF Transcript_2/g.10 Transcript_2/m.10 type:complete len:682 (+) Transcript_2:79-2124(+)